MAINISEGVAANVENLVSQVSFLNAIVQFLGGIVAVYLIYVIIRLVLQRKKDQEISEIKEIVKKIERKVNKL